MNLNEYQRAAAKTAVYPPSRYIEYPVVGMANEAGEALGRVKKHMRGDFNLRDRDNAETVMQRAALKKELGDVLWYIAMAATDMGMTLEEVAVENLGKLAARKKAGTIQGDGDDR